MKTIIIALILIVNLILAFIGDITYLIYLAGVVLMINIIKQINSLWR